LSRREHTKRKLGSSWFRNPLGKAQDHLLRPIRVLGSLEPASPAILVRVKDGTYSEALRKLKCSWEVKVVVEDIVGLSKTRKGDLLVRLKPEHEPSGKIIEAIGMAMVDKTATKE